MSLNNKKISPEIQKKIRQLQIHTRRLLNSSLVGDNRSAIKGAGFEFNQIKEYQCGDDVRFIDWKASARMNTFLIKECIEERSRDIFLLVDSSHSRLFSSSELIKHDFMAQIASVLSLVSFYAKDRVGLILFSDQIEKYIPPARTSFHVHKIMQELFSFEPCKNKTNISVALKFLLKIKKNNGVVFMISDFIDEKVGTYCAQVARRHDFIAVR